MLKSVMFINELKYLNINYIMSLSSYLYLRSHEKKSL